MALSAKISTQAAWQSYLKKAGIPEKETTIYAKLLHDNRIYHPADQSKDILKDLGISIIGDQIAILKYAKMEEPSDTRP